MSQSFRASSSLHSPSSCHCLRLLAGPWHTWGRLERQAETVMEPDTHISVGSGCSVARGSIYTSPCARQVVAMQRGGDLQAKVQVVEYTHLGQYNRHPLQVVSHQDTLVVKCLTPKDSWRLGQYSIEVFQCATGALVCALDLTQQVTKDRLQAMEIGDIVLAEDTIIIHLLFKLDQETKEDRPVLQDNETQIWRIDTANPGAGEGTTAPAGPAGPRAPDCQHWVPGEARHLGPAPPPAVRGEGGGAHTRPDACHCAG